MGRDVQECRCCCFGLAKANLKNPEVRETGLDLACGLRQGAERPGKHHGVVGFSETGRSPWVGSERPPDVHSLPNPVLMDPRCGLVGPRL